MDACYLTLACRLGGNMKSGRKRNSPYGAADERGVVQRRGRPSHRSPALARRNEDWRRLVDELNWTYEKIAKVCSMSSRSIRAGVKVAREMRDAQAAAEALRENPDLAELLEGRHDDPAAVRAWLEDQSGRRSED